MVEVFLPPTIEIHPVNTIGELYLPTSLICTASGNPAPNIKWYKDNVIIPNTNSNPSVLLFTELNLKDRGFYHCEASNVINGIMQSDVSSDVILNIKGGIYDM